MDRSKRRGPDGGRAWSEIRDKAIRGLIGVERHAFGNINRCLARTQRNKRPSVGMLEVGSLRYVRSLDRRTDSP